MPARIFGPSKGNRRPTTAIPGSSGAGRPAPQLGGGGNKAAGSPEPTVASSTVETVSPTGVVTPGAGANDQQRHEIRVAQAEARQQKIVDHYVNQVASPKAKSSPLGFNLNTNIQKAKSNVGELRDKLLNHPAVQKANEEGKVVGPKGLTQIRQQASAFNALTVKGPLTHPPALPNPEHQDKLNEQHSLEQKFPSLGRTRNFIASHPQGIPGIASASQMSEDVAHKEAGIKRHEEQELIKQSESGLSAGDIFNAAKDVYNSLSQQQPNPLGHAIEDEAKNAVEAVVQRQKWELEGTSMFHGPTAKEVQLLSNAAMLASGVGEAAKAADVLGQVATKEGASELGSAVAEKAASKVAAAKAAPGVVAQAVRDLPDAVRATPDALKAITRAAPQAAADAAKAVPGKAVQGVVDTANTGSKVLGLGGVGLVTNKAGIPIPVVKNVPSMLEGTVSAVEHHPQEVLETTARTIPGFFTAPASIVEAGVESALHGTPKPLTNTVSNIASGTKEMGEHLLSGNPQEVEQAIRSEVGLTPYLPAPAILHQLHGSDLYTESIRAPLRKAVEDKRASVRENTAARNANDGLNAPKEPGRLGTQAQKYKMKPPVPVPGRPGEHYILRPIGQALGNHADRVNVALDATRASEFAHTWNQIERNRLAKAAHGKTSLSPLADEMGRSYEAASTVMAKYGIPHDAKGLDLLENLEDYYGAPSDISRPDRAITDRIATHEAVQNPEIVNDKKHEALTEEVRAGQKRLAAELPGDYTAKPFRIQSDFTNHLRVKAGETPILKDTERITQRAHQFTSPEEAATSLRNLADREEVRATKVRDAAEKADNPKEKQTKLDQAAAIERNVKELRLHADQQEQGFGLDHEQVSRQGAWAHYEDLKAQAEKLRKEARDARIAGKQKQADNLYGKARQVQAQKKQLYSELKTFTRNPDKVDTSTLSGSGRAMRREFVNEQRKVNKQLGLVEPVHLHDEVPTTPGPKTSKGVTRSLPGRVQHFSTGEIARSGEADARLEHVLHHSAVMPRTQVALNDLVSKSLNDLKVPVRTESGAYKHILTEDEKTWAENTHTMPAGTEFFPTPLLKAALKGSHAMDSDEALAVIETIRNSDTPEGIKKLVERYPDLKDEIYSHNKGKGLTYTAVRGAGVDELIKQLKGAQMSRLRQVANIPTRIILNDPAWVFAQLFAKGIPIASALGPEGLLRAPSAIKAMNEIQKMDPVSQARIKAMVGSSAGVLGSPHGAFYDNDPYTQARLVKRSGPGRVVWNLANGNTMGAWDRWNAAKMREFAAAVRSSKDFKNWYGGVKGLDKSMGDISRLTKGMSTADRLKYLSEHPSLARAVQDSINKIGGNWQSFTAMERKVQPFVVFYPWLKYAFTWTLHTFPVNHPVAATALAFLAQRNANELQKIASEEATKAGVKGVTPQTPLQDILGYTNPVHRNAANEPVENPSGHRFSPFGTVSETILTGNPLKVVEATNPWINTGISLATDTNTFTGQKLKGSLGDNLLEQAVSLVPLGRTAESAIGFRGFAKGGPQSAWSKAYEVLQGGKGTKALRSFVNPYSDRPVSKGALENALNKIGDKIAKTGSEAQAKIAGDLLHGSAQNKRETEKLKSENKQAWSEFEKLLKVIDPSGALSKQSTEEYEHYKASLPSLGGSSGGIYGGGSSIYNNGSIYKGSSIYGGKSGENLIFHPHEEGVHLPHISIPGLGSITGTISSLAGNAKAEAAEPTGKVNVPAPKLPQPPGRELISSNPQRSKEFRKAEHLDNQGSQNARAVASKLKNWGLNPEKVAILGKVEKETGVPAALLASISYTESTNGTSSLPGVHSGSNPYGAAGPFQMGNGTGASGDAWQTYSAKVWGSEASKHSVYNYADAARAAAEYLKETGVTSNPSTWYNGAFSYNHAGWYASEVSDRAKEASKLPWSGTGGAAIELARVPKQSLTRYQAGVKIAKKLASEHVPYVWGGGHGDGFTSKYGLDCSGAVSMVLHAMMPGKMKEPLTSGNMGQVLRPGPGAVTVFYNGEHTFMKIGNKYFGTSVDNSSKGLAFYGAPSQSYLNTFNVGHVPGLGTEVAKALGIINHSTGGSVASGGEVTASDFPGMEFSNNGTKATIRSGQGTKTKNPTVSDKPIESALARLGKVEKLFNGNYTGIGIPKVAEAESKVGPSISDLEQVAQSINSARESLAVH
ncbi:MAG: hypothetical protein JSS68_14970 [Actinobacteria bacterium]|nr:hypothetical protein [Actinomycetota bacterium]